MTTTESRKIGMKIFLCIRNLNYAYLTLSSRLHNFHLEFFTCPHKFKWILMYRKTGFQDF